MRRLALLLVLTVAPAIGVAADGQAAGNPVVEALTKGSVVQFTGKEGISTPFEFDITVATGDKTLNVGMAVGQPIAIGVAAGRVVSGMVERAEQVDGPGSPGLYRLHLVPSAGRLKYRATSRTFYDKRVTDIVSQLLEEAGVANVELRVAVSQPVEPLIVQYQESDFQLLSRLLEGAGLHYHAEAGPAGDKFVIGDTNAAFPPSGPGAVTFGGGGQAITSFSRGQALHSGLVQTGDYNWQTPAADLSMAAQAPVFGDLAERIFPAGVETKPEAQLAANARLAARVAEGQVCSGESTSPHLQAGTKVLLSGHPRADFNQEYVITAVEHQRTGKEYRNTFRCLPSQVLFRPLPSTPIPVVAGVVSGIVVGPPGETKFVDQYGRVKVRFPWRSPVHSNQNDPGDAGFVRVAQIATGAGATAMWLPDVGEEVLVAFEYGDPRRPVVVGSVYNAKDMPPVALPANKHLSILRQQTPGGGRTDLVFDGTPGNERLSIQSPSMALVSAGDYVQRTGRAVVIEAATDVTVRTGQNLTVTSGGNLQTTVGGSWQTSIGTDVQWSVGRNMQTTVGSNAVLETGKDLSIRAGQHLQLQSARTTRLTVGDDALIQVGKSLVTNVGTMFQFVAAQTGTIQTARGLAIRSGGDIEILGDDISIKSSGNLTMKGSKITQN